MFGVDVVEEVEDASGVVGDAVVRPRLEVEVEDPPLVILQGEMYTVLMDERSDNFKAHMYRVIQQVMDLV